MLDLANEVAALAEGGFISKVLRQIRTSICQPITADHFHAMAAKLACLAGVRRRI
jgi:hypothetical protein